MGCVRLLWIVQAEDVPFSLRCCRGRAFSLAQNLGNGALGDAGVAVAVDIAMDAIEGIERLESGCYDVLLLPSFLRAERVWVTEFAMLIRDLQCDVAIFFFHDKKTCMRTADKHLSEGTPKLQSLVSLGGGRDVPLVDGRIPDPMSRNQMQDRHRNLGLMLRRRLLPETMVGSSQTSACGQKPTLVAAEPFLDLRAELPGNKHSKSESHVEAGICDLPGCVVDDSQLLGAPKILSSADRFEDMLGEKLHFASCSDGQTSQSNGCVPDGLEACFWDVLENIEA